MNYDTNRQSRGTFQSNTGSHHPNANHRDGTVTVDYRGAWNKVKGAKDSKALRDTQKQCCNPALNEIEQKILNAPASTRECIIFRYSFEACEYEYDNYEPYKCNNIGVADIAAVLQELQQVDNFRPDLIKPNNKMVWFATIFVILLIASLIICDYYIPWIFAIILDCVMIIPCVWMIVSIVRKQRKQVKELSEQRA